MANNKSEREERPLVNIKDLTVIFEARGNIVHALDTVTLSINAGERIGIVGESGSGKSTLALALGGHIQGAGRRSGGSVDVVSTDVFTASPEALVHLRRGHLGYIFQNPIGTLDPTRKVSRQFFGTDGRPISEARIADVLEQVSLDDIPRVLKSYPHELSGGMAQRVAIAMAIEHEPRIIIADEPTSSLDASIRLQILDLLKEISIRSGAALIIVSHDLKAVRSYCERVAVMYAGRIVELGDSKDVFAEPSHPYTAALIRAMPGEEGIDGEIRGIRGNPPLVTKRLEACAFAERCDYVLDECWHLRPEPTSQNNRRVSCHLASRGISARAAEC